MNRIKMADLRRALTILNNTQTVHSYALTAGYGGWRLIYRSEGGETAVLHGYRSKRVLYDIVGVMIDTYRDSRMHRKATK